MLAIQEKLLLISILFLMVGLNPKNTQEAVNTLTDSLNVF